MAGVSYTVDKNERTPDETAENQIYPERVRAEKEADKKADVIVPKPPEAWNIRRTASLERSKQEAAKPLWKMPEKGILIIIGHGLWLWTEHQDCGI
ncbi:hypothetical protein QUF90_27040 [Desulfococcaceae bacterium HSG9]|nr:hypothetical protein [Desulfococcaceae bacterium HSG9]